MKTTLIKLQDKFILVSDEEINQDDNIIRLSNFEINIANDENDVHEDWKKIIAGIPELPSTNLSDLKEADCKTIGWVNIEKLIKPLLEECFGKDVQYKNESVSLLTDFYTEGFKTAQSLNDKRFSDEDIIKAMNEVREDYNSTIIDIRNNNEIIQSLQQTTSWQVEVQLECGEQRQCNCIDNSECLKPQSKITNNSIKVTKIL